LSCARTCGRDGWRARPRALANLEADATTSTIAPIATPTSGELVSGQASVVTMTRVTRMLSGNPSTMPNALNASLLAKNIRTT
jgi:hypothetical protein